MQVAKWGWGRKRSGKCTTGWCSSHPLKKKHYHYHISMVKMKYDWLHKPNSVSWILLSYLQLGLCRCHVGASTSFRINTRRNKQMQRSRHSEIIIYIYMKSRANSTWTCKQAKPTLSTVEENKVAVKNAEKVVLTQHLEINRRAMVHSRSLAEQKKHINKHCPTSATCDLLQSSARSPSFLPAVVNCRLWNSALSHRT